MCQASRNPALDAQAGHSQAAKERSKPTDDSIGGHEHRLSFDRSQLEFELPEELIAPFPPPKREDARLLVVSRGDGTLSDEHVGELPELLRPGDLLILNDTYDAGWQAWVNGNRTPIFRTNLYARGVQVPAGNSEVRFLYRPPSLWWGFLCSLLTLVVSLFFVVRCWRRGR